MAPLRIGLVSYLNCLPLKFGLEATGGLEGVELVGGTPAQTNAALLSGSLDAGLVSAASWARNRDRLGRLPGYGITSYGPTMSVLLATREGTYLSGARRVALTSESETSQVLAKIVLGRVYGAAPFYEPVNAPPEETLASYDAALFIGDTALAVRRMPGVEVYDLGALWKLHAGLPMVYAVWGTLGGAARRALWEERVARAVRWADANLDAVVEEAEQRGAPATKTEIKTYLSSCIRYPIGAREEEGLERYLTEGGFPFPGIYGKVSA